MPTAANTYGLAQAIHDLVAGSLYQAIPLQGGVSPGYKTIHIGALKDYTDDWPCLEIEATQDQTTRHALGGKIRDETTFLLRSVVLYSGYESGVAEYNIAALRDALTVLLHQHATLQAADGVVRAALEPRMRFGYLLRNGQFWRVHECLVHVSYDYTVTVVP